jgi:hypothetical protein
MLAVAARLLAAIVSAIRGVVVAGWCLVITTLITIVRFGVVSGFVITIRCWTILWCSTPV